MKKVLVSIVILFVPINIYCQRDSYEKPDYKKIEKTISDANSEYYYPDLFNRYKNSDTTLTLQDFRLLYYGFLFNDLYSVYGSSEFADSVNQTISKENLNLYDYEKLIRFEKQILEEYPFNLRDLYMLANAYFQTGDTLSTIQTYYKLDMIVETILSSGNGESEKTAWHVISVSHEYDILGILGFQYGGTQILTNKGCDYLEVVENDYNIKGFYFDVNMLLDKQAELFR